jgi:hypothetical protein
MSAVLTIGDREVSRTGTETRRIVALALAVCSLGAAAIHFAVFGEHLEEYWLYGAFFALVAWVQAMWAAWVAARPSMRALTVGFVVNAIVIATWIITRTVGIGIGPAVGPEAVGLADAISTLLELAIVIGTALLVALRGLGRITTRTAWSAIAAVTSVVVIASTVALSSPSHEHDASAGAEVAATHTHQEVPR